MRTIFGAIAGDVIGSFYEFHAIKTKSFELFPYGSRFTDDTVMTLAIARWLMEDETQNEYALIDSMCELGNRYLRAGYGGNFLNWLRNEPTPYNSWGNGSAMRVSSVGLWAETLEECLELAEKTAAVSHNHPEGIKGAQAVAACMFIALHWEGNVEDLKQRIKEYVTETFGYNLERTLEEIRPTYHFDVSCQGSVPEAIIAFLEAESFEDAIRNAVSLGGDADTQAAIAGSIAACVWPIPDNILKECKEYLTSDLQELAENFDLRCKHKHQGDFFKYNGNKIVCGISVDKIISLKPNEIFVFGSNLAGAHAGGAAYTAMKYFGAVRGQGIGLQGQSYAIPTMHGGLEDIRPYVDQFIDFAKANPQQNFMVTRIGCGIAGFRDEEMAPLFADCLFLVNVFLPRRFIEALCK